MNRVNIVFAIIGMLFISVWGVSELLVIRDVKLQLSILISIAAVGLLLSVKASFPLDAKFLIIVLFGYMIGAKGFAYLSPAPPVFIGEIFLFVAFIMMFMRHGSNVLRHIMNHSILIFISLILLLGLIRLYVDFPIYKLMAIRDSSMIYYSVLAICASLLFTKPRIRVSFEKVFPYALVLGCIGYMLPFFVGESLKVPMLYVPHPDIAVPVAVAGFVYGYFQLLKHSSLKSLVFFAIPLICIVTASKSAFFFATVGTLVFIYLARPNMKMLLHFSAAGFMVMLSVAMAIVMGYEVGDNFAETDLGDTFTSLQGGQDTAGTTTEWRLVWWQTIYEDTMEQNPILGAGFGADITSSFLYKFYGVQIEAQKLGYARYPHSFVFTALGRFGIVGVLIFGLYSIFFLRLIYIKLKLFLRGGQLYYHEIAITAFVLAGFFNSFVQANFETPYSAILHWVCLGYVIAATGREKQVEPADDQVLLRQRELGKL